MAPGRYWLLKAEPDSRLVKGKDVKFSVDDFETVKTSPWEGVRNYEARNLMKEMKIGEKKTKKDDPKWFMVDLTFISRATHFVPLALLRFLSDSNTLPPEVDYIREDGLKALKAMDLVGRGRLSVQRVEESAWNAIIALAEKGGWEELDLKAKGKRPAKSPAAKPKPKPGRKPITRKAQNDAENEEKKGEDDEDTTDETPQLEVKRGTKRKAKGGKEDEDYSAAPTRRRRAER
ncbi:hypothetical protein C0995_009132 [Termitomyces sp. Mi166|nr:hypothetical protein C0995_009132 [Termitomyces sp. Mi166\